MGCCEGFLYRSVPIRVLVQVCLTERFASRSIPTSVSIPIYLYLYLYLYLHKGTYVLVICFPVYVWLRLLPSTPDPVTLTVSPQP